MILAGLHLVISLSIYSHLSILTRLYYMMGTKINPSSSSTISGKGCPGCKESNPAVTTIQQLSGLT